MSDPESIACDKISDFVNKVKIVKPEEWNKLYQEYREYISLQSRNESAISDINVFFKIAQDTRNALEPWIISRLAKDHPELLKEEDESGDQLLNFAIKKKRVWFINSILNSKVPLCHILGPTEATNGNPHNNNPIAQAIKQGLDSSIIIRLIEAADKHTLETTDSSGKTPLHYAVDSSKCKGDQLKVIRTLLEKGDKALDQYTSKPNYFSVYTYHMHTRTLPENSKGHSANAPEAAGTTQSTVSKSKNGNEDTWEKGAHGLGNDNQKSVYQTKEEKKSEQLEYGVDVSSGNLQGGRNRANEGRPLSDTQSKAHEQSIEDPSTTSETRTGPNSNAGEGRNADAKGSEEEVASLLKLHYLRTTFRSETSKETGRDHNSAEKFLFGDNPKSKHLTFSLLIIFDLICRKTPVFYFSTEAEAGINSPVPFR